MRWSAMTPLFLALWVGCDRCGGGESDSGTDTHSDVDTEPDSDTDPVVEVEDCGDGVDDDHDGLVDCEDDDCVDVCMEDCADHLDNDGDGFVDCDDDECSADVACLASPYVIEATMTIDWAVISGAQAYVYVGYGAASAGQNGRVLLTGTPVDPTLAPFECQGTVTAYPPALGYQGLGGMTYAPDACDGCDYRFLFEPRRADRSLVWRAPCPIESFPPVYLGFTYGSGDVTMDDGAGVWGVQYHTPNYEWYVEYPGSPREKVYGYLEAARQTVPRTWTGDYFLP